MLRTLPSCPVRAPVHCAVRPGATYLSKQAASTRQVFLGRDDRPSGRARSASSRAWRGTCGRDLLIGDGATQSVPPENPPRAFHHGYSRRRRDIDRGRVLAIGFLAVWGAFFVEHLGWFLHPGQGFPPARVWLLQLVHLAQLAGLLMLIRWEIPGSVLKIAAAPVFFAAVAGR